MKGREERGGGDFEKEKVTFAPNREFPAGKNCKEKKIENIDEIQILKVAKTHGMQGGREEKIPFRKERLGRSVTRGFLHPKHLLG